MSMESETIRRSNAHVQGLQLQESVPDISRLSLEKKGQPSSQRMPRQTETDADLVFSTGDTSMQGTGREARNHLNMASQSSMGGIEEHKSAGGGNSRRNRLEPQMIPSEYPPPELGRPSLSESTGAPSKNFSP